MSSSGIELALKRLGVSRKKTLQQHPKANEQARITFLETIKIDQANNRSIVYIYESYIDNSLKRCPAPMGMLSVGSFV